MCRFRTVDVFEQGGGGADAVGSVRPAGGVGEGLEGEDACGGFLLGEVFVVVVEGGGEGLLEGGVGAPAVERADGDVGACGDQLGTFSGG